jgi:Flp pilus assembly protein TadG
MKRFLILIIAITAMISCSKDSSDNPSGLKIRLSNSSQYNFKDIVINTTTGDVNFGNLNSGEKTEYKEFNKAYRYAFVKLEIDGKTYTIQPIDYVGESTLKDGSYTYQIDVNNTQDQYTNLSLTLIEE